MVNDLTYFTLKVCSAYLGIHDNDRRLADHFGGKLHLGFIQIRLADFQPIDCNLRQGETGRASSDNGCQEVRVHSIIVILANPL